MENQKDNFQISISFGKDGEPKVRFNSDLELPLKTITNFLHNVNPDLQKLADEDLGLILELGESKPKRKKKLPNTKKTKKVSKKPLKTPKKASPKKVSKSKAKKVVKKRGNGKSKVNR